MLDREDIDALLDARHGDPFAVLGPHPSDDGLWIRALLPGAIGVEVLDEAGELAGPLDRLVRDGTDTDLFEGRLDARAPDLAYRLRVRYPHDHVVELDDPYRFASTIDELDRYLLGEGSHLRPWRVLGAHPRSQQGVAGVRFCVWAPTATRVSVVGDFNDWDGRRHPMRAHPGTGLWELFVPGIGAGALYKFELRPRDGGAPLVKADPVAFATQLRPDTASVVAPPATDRPLPATRRDQNHRHAPVSIYEVHLGSWRRHPGDRPFYAWSELAASLPAYVAELGFTHVELLPVAEHPFDGSWGYQVTAMFAPSARFGPPQGFADFVEACHAAGLGVILDWVPAHFPNDPHGLARFDGSCAYEYEDPREGLHRDWDTLIYNFRRNEVRNFLLGSALFWLERFGVDGLRVDAVASMLYRDYSREHDEWIANERGGRENLEAVSLLQRLNEIVGAEAPGAVTIAEESTAWAGVSQPTSSGGLGFHYKWNMGWMHDTLAYMQRAPEHRKYHHNQLTFGLMYAWAENFVLPLSHDEVVHGKRALIDKMPGDRWQRFANLRAYYGFMWTQPGKKLLFMGGEFAQPREWNHDRELDWALLDAANEDGAPHRGVRELVRDLNLLYRDSPALHELDCEPAGFEWIEADDAERSVLAWLRRDRAGAELLVVCNFTPVPRHGDRVGLPQPGRWVERLNTDAARYGGSGVGNDGPIDSDPVPAHGRAHSLALTLPPLATLILAPAP